MSRFEDALQFAAKAHEGMHRKGSLIPFIIHPMEAATIASGLTSDEDVIIAALLHDTIEDAGVTEESIRRRFGAKVLSLVLADTEKIDPVRESGDTWLDCKAEMIRYMKEYATKDEKIVILSDRLSNLRCIYNDMVLMGDDAWAIFHEQTNPTVHAWFYGEIGDLIEEFRDTPAYEEYRALVHKVFSAYGR